MTSLNNDRSGASGGSVSGSRVLVVDDSKLIRTAASKILESEYTVILANDGEEAWKLIGEDPTIQVVFSDLTMPKLDGFALLRKVRDSESARIKALPLIIMTLDTDDESRRETALRLGATDFISKPFNSVDLKARAKAHATIEIMTRELKQRAELLERNANRDLLTGLNNRSFLIEKLWQDCSSSSQQKTPLSVLRFDIDAFNQIFVEAGKEKANQVMQLVADKVAGKLRDSDTAARIGLSTIVVVTPGYDVQEARQLADSIRSQVSKLSCHTESGNQKITLSCALVSSEQDTLDQPDTILIELERLANEAMDKGGDQIMPADKNQAGKLRFTADDDSQSSAVNLQSVDQALQCLANGDIETVRNNMPALARKIIPLLQLADEKLKQELLDKLKLD